MRRFNAAVTMFVFLRGRSVLEYYFDLKDAYRAANDACSPSVADIIGLRQRKVRPERK